MCKFKKIVTIMSVIVAVTTLAACGKTEKKNSTEDKTEEKTVIETKENDEEPVSETKEEIPDSEEEEFVEITSNTDSTAVINNNGHFVQIGDKIYFHIADADSLGRSALWGKYSDNECGRTILFEYVPVTDEVVPETYDYSSGGLSIQGDTLYTMEYDDFNNSEEIETKLCAYSFTKGINVLELPGDNAVLLGAGEDGSYIAVYNYEYLNNTLDSQIAIYVDGKLENSFKLDNYSGVVALGKRDIFYIAGDSDDGFSLYQADVSNGEIIELGILPKFEESSWNGYIDECILDEEGIYFNYSDYEGTGNFFAQGYFVEAKIGKKDSLCYRNMPEYTVDGEERATPFTVKNGEMIAAQGEPGTCEVSSEGDLGYFDESGEWKKVAEGWATEYLNDEGDFKGVELAEKLGDYIYLIYNGNVRAPEDDIGWRYAYYRNYTNVYRVSVETGESSRLIHQAAPWSD